MEFYRSRCSAACVAALPRARLIHFLSLRAAFWKPHTVPAKVFTGPRTRTTAASYRDDGSAHILYATSGAQRPYSCSNAIDASIHIGLCSAVGRDHASLQGQNGAPATGALWNDGGPRNHRIRLVG